MKVIFKYPLNEQRTARLPHGAKVLHVNSQDGKYFVWAEVDSAEQTLFDRKFLIYGTGHAHQEKVDQFYINTFFSGNYIAPLVFHAYEIASEITGVRE